MNVIRKALFFSFTAALKVWTTATSTVSFSSIKTQTEIAPAIFPQNKFIDKIDFSNTLNHICSHL
ncbi:hypothetical protein GcM3_c11015o16 [Golovinomyces cichoracearum]|uniref:Uncharacterized protein n=1 Tax=Golovinomyces cichoracearum TaxID=62708 RepID=A0A420JAI3_9PEZI|nr:hypothetical protein GcM3_c11015o16 [Golovinomyces cichoracearum]